MSVHGEKCLGIQDRGIFEIILVTKVPDGQQRTQKGEQKVSLRKFSSADFTTIIAKLERSSKKTHRKNTRTTQECSELNQYDDQSLWGAWSERDDFNSICLQLKGTERSDSITGGTDWRTSW